MRNVRVLRAVKAVPSTPTPTSGAPRSTVPQRVPSGPTISLPKAIALPPGRRKNPARDASQEGAVRSAVSPRPITPRQRTVETPLGGSAATAMAPPASAAVGGTLELQPAIGNAGVETVPSDASQRALAFASPYTCQTTRVSPAAFMAPPSIRLPADQA